MKLKQVISVLLFSLIIGQSALSPVLADDEVRNLEIDLKAKGFADSEWVDNLDKTHVLFSPGTKFQIRLQVKNNGNRTQTQIKADGVLPDTVTMDSSEDFTIPEIAPGADYAKIFTVTVKDKKFVNKDITGNTIRYNVVSDVNTKAGDFTVFYTNNGEKTAKKDEKILPKTGSNGLLTGSLLSTSLIASALFLRKKARGY